MRISVDIFDGETLTEELLGELRRESHNTTLLPAAAASLPPGVRLEIFDGLADGRPGGVTAGAAVLSYEVQVILDQGV